MDSYFPALHSFIALSVAAKKKRKHFLFSDHLFLHSPNSSSGFNTFYVPETLDPFSQINARILEVVDLNWLCSQGCFAAFRERSFRFYKSVGFYIEYIKNLKGHHDKGKAICVNKKLRCVVRAVGTSCWPPAAWVEKNIYQLEKVHVKSSIAVN